MRPDDDAADLEEIEIESEMTIETDAPGTDAPAADPAEAAVDVDPIAEIDEDLLEADLGEFDALLADDDLDEFEEELLDEPEDEDEDDYELALLQELGIVDLDAPDAESFRFGLDVEIDDDTVDDEVAA